MAIIAFNENDMAVFRLLLLLIIGALIGILFGIFRWGGYFLVTLELILLGMFWPGSHFSLLTDTRKFRRWPFC